MQADQGLYCRLTESMDTLNIQKPIVDYTACRLIILFVWLEDTFSHGTAYMQIVKMRLACTCAQPGHDFHCLLFGLPKTCLTMYSCSLHFTDIDRDNTVDVTC